MSREDFEAYIPSVSQKPDITRQMFYGILVVLVFFGGLFLWSILVTIDAAALAPGQIIIEGRRQTIQHLEGGIIDKIYVRDGSVVEKGAPLIQLDTTQNNINLDVVQAQLYELMANKARLVAQRDGLDSITLDQRLAVQMEEKNIANIVRAQRALFDSEKKAYEGQLSILNYKATQLEEEIKSLQAQVVSSTEQLKLIDEELKALIYLAERNLVEKPRLLAIQREKAKLLGGKGEYLGRIARARQQIAETKSQSLTLTEERKKKNLEELRDTRQKIAEALEREKSILDIIHRATIVAPHHGEVVGLQKHTEHGVISPGQPVLDIVPSEARLLVEARVNPMDIDIVKKGLPAKVTLSAYKQRNVPTLVGEVSMVSADIIKDEKTGEQYYNARIAGLDEQLKELKHVHLYPGMPVQVMIITDNRTPLAYLLDPVKASLKRAFREH